MTRYERKLFFERLVQLREAYRAEANVATELTVEAVFAFAENSYNGAAAADVATTTVKGAPAAD